MNEERIKEVFSDEAFVKQLFEQESPEQVQELLLDKEIDLSVDEIKKLRELIEKHISGELNLEELSDEELESVSGGIVEVAAFFAILGGMLLLAGAGFVGASACIVDAEVREARKRW